MTMRGESRSKNSVFASSIYKNNRQVGPGTYNNPNEGIGKRTFNQHLQTESPKDAKK